MPHGTTTSYTAGCRCDSCKGAASAYYLANRDKILKRVKARRITPPKPYPCEGCGQPIKPTGERGRPRRLHKDCLDPKELAIISKRSKSDTARALREEAKQYEWPRSGYPRQYSSGHSYTSDPEYRANRAIVLVSDICGICGHPGARHCDHIIGRRSWPRDDQGEMLPGFHALTNLQPAHGSGKPNNVCPECPQGFGACNQEKR